MIWQLFDEVRMSSIDGANIPADDTAAEAVYRGDVTNTVKLSCVIYAARIALRRAPGLDWGGRSNYFQGLLGMTQEPTVKTLKDYVRVGEAATILGVTTKTLRNWDRAGKVKARRHPVNGYRINLREES